ncbi:MAG: DnaJ domain-containing protein [Bacillota bacterium]
MKSIELERKARRILGVPDDADKAKIRLAFRQLAKQYHPDKNGGDEAATDKFKLVSEAYEILIREKNRGKYSLIKDDASSSDDAIFKDDERYWEWWKERFGDLI